MDPRLPVASLTDLKNQKSFLQESKENRQPSNILRKTREFVPEPVKKQQDKVALYQDKKQEKIKMLSTVRLKPISQNTRHGTISILADGFVLLDFKADVYLIKICKDGDEVRNSLDKKVCLYERNSFSEQSKPVITYKRKALTGNYLAKYIYACKFVELVRAKTPKVKLLVHVRLYFILLKRNAS